MKMPSILSLLLGLEIFSCKNNIFTNAFLVAKSSIISNSWHAAPKSPLTTLMVSIETPNVPTQSLAEFDPDLAAMVNAEDQRQRKGLELIASENFVSKAVREVLGSCLTNKYSEGGGESPLDS